MLAAAYFRFEENEMSTTTVANPDEFMDAESFAELGEAAAANTVIDYMYRDGSNWKTGAQVIFAGRITRDEDRKSVVSGKSVSVRVDLGGRRIIKKKNQKKT